TANGKIDKKALPAPETESQAPYTAPRNQREEEIVQMWEEILGEKKEKIGVDRNFFQLGGHSLSATGLIVRIHKRYGIKIPIGEIFKTPTIRGISQYMENAGHTLYATLEPVEEKEYYPLSAAQKRLYFFAQWEKGNITYNGLKVFLLEGKLNTAKMEETFKQLIKRQESLRTTFEMVAGEPVQRIHGDVPFELEYYNRGKTGTAGDELLKDIVKPFVRTFQLNRAPLMRVALIETEDLHHLILIDIHHIISDGITIDIFIREFMDLYSGKPLPALQIRYKDFTDWHNRENETIKKQEEYWQKEYEGEIAVLRLPLDYPRPPVQQFDGKCVKFEITGKNAAGLKKMATAEEATIFIVLMALFNILISKLSGQ
ncbi:MAG: non-ribosomal peptide synthetase, partial [bacterium]|nr:non-ribosomal peptide synthetase [bacterium]